LNTETGVPLTLLKLEPEHTALVVEMGLQRVGDIARLGAPARPRIGVITNIGLVHMEFFESQEQLAREKGALVAGLPPDGTAVLNADDPLVSLLESMSSARVTTFGADHGLFRVEAYSRLTDGGAEFFLQGVTVRLPLSGRHQALNAAAALAAGDAAGVPGADGARAPAEVEVKQRLEEKRTRDGILVVDDAYNASPESMTAAFDAGGEMPREGRLLAVLGHMGELGEMAEAAHILVGKAARPVFDAIAVVDTPLGRILAGAAGAEGVPDNEAAVDWVRAHARPGDRVLVKGSHSRHLDEVVAELMR